MSEYLLATHGLTKQFGHHKAVDHVDLHVKKGSIYGFIGRNGAGKTTFLKMISGLSQPTSGEIEMFGYKNAQLKNVRSRISCLIESPGLYGNMSAYDNLAVKCRLFGINDKRYIENILKTVGLSNVGKKKTKHFSLGMKQRLGIGMALVGEPDLLLLDEPINGLDPEGIREVREVIQYLNDTKKMTIIISSHILGELSKIATKYGIIRDGHMVEEITAKELDKRCRNYLSLKVDQADKAIPLLEKSLNIKDYTVHENNEIWIYDEVKSSDVSMQLAQNGVEVNQVYYQKQDLESYFLEKCGGEE